MRGVKITGALQMAVVALLNAALQLVVAFGVSVSDTQNAAITGVVNGIFLLAAVIIGTNSTSGTPPSPPATP